MNNKDINYNLLATGQVDMSEYFRRLTSDSKRHEKKDLLSPERKKEALKAIKDYASLYFIGTDPVKESIEAIVRKKEETIEPKKLNKADEVIGLLKNITIQSKEQCFLLEKILEQQKQQNKHLGIIEAYAKKN